ncbi:hypothetical protein NP233_g9776 [Leucocoprinus birnbaumii]|uniref:F-box domain-containing protein n=1 Tax=Leucocoprinus birnbaumii TaxID=56174 RepID=A0AAD5YSJ0_9AGAR|nr:hypothetical protein NP233_g9776 [Leucocoprinus birnbaumii]
MIGSASLSSIFGWISIACWIVVYSPQIYENYELQSGEGLSIMFVLIWLAGDLCNLIGAVLAGLIPTVIILACYYSLCDSTLLCQVFYYRWKNGQPLFKPKPVEDDERAPLLPGREEAVKKHLSARTLMVRYTAALIFVCMVGTTAWWITRNNHEDAPKPVPKKDWWKSQIFGWASALFFIGARVPQIIKNFKTRCEGLSPALFFFAMCGNIMYSSSILAKSTDWHYLVTNASWLAGSGLVVSLDIFVLCQFVYYRAQDRRRGEESREIAENSAVRVSGNGGCGPKERTRGQGVAKTIGVCAEICLVAFLVSEMFITTSHVAGHSSGFSGSLVHLLLKHLHALRLVLARNTTSGSPLSGLNLENAYNPSLSIHSSRPLLLLQTRTDSDAYVPRPMPQGKISSLREAINNLDTQMADLMTQRQVLKSQLEQEVRLQSPVIRLPSELLSSIFVMGVLGMGDGDPIIVSTLMLVCRYWAEVALNTPVLWAKINVSPHNPLEKARRRLQRSKSCPLDITVNFAPRLDYPFSVSEQVMLAMDLFRPALWRTKTFSLSVPNRSQVHAALLQWKDDAPLLESLSIHIYHSIQEDHAATPTAPFFIGNTPRLRSCSFTSFNFGWDLRLLTRLRVLKLGGYFNGSTPSPLTLITVLRQCPDLEELALRNISDVDSYPCGPPPGSEASLGGIIQLPRLTQASFYCTGNALALQIMSQIAFPKLERLELCYLQNINPILNRLHSQALTKLSLKYLRIESCLFTEMTFVHVLRRLSSLTTLEVVDIEDLSSYFLKSMSASQPWICPRLEEINLDGCTSLEWDSLRAFVEARLPPNPNGFTRYYTSASTMTTSASAAAAAQARAKAHYTSHSGVLPPQRLRSIDVTRCTQISWEMIQWLKMYVAEVRCDTPKGVWGENVLP